jgi:hypothetical protein
VSPSWATSSTARESRDADIGVSLGSGKGQIFLRGQILERLLEEALKLAEQPGGPAA